ncbi:MAG: alpha/beta hydrolase [Actinomycetota bacterium]|nr:alpha/beta hydrolase [Actinomycetota bacterium]
MTDSIEVPGPWQHRKVTARGTRFHVAEAGDGPLVLFLHGFPEFWWAWRHQLPAFASSGYRAVAVDLKGVGASDHPPRGYDVPSLADDMAGVIRALGAEDAVVVGHDWGGLLGWTLGSQHPELVRRLVVLSAAHPRQLRAGTLTRPRQLLASQYAWQMQLPWLPERRMARDSGGYVEELLRAWSAPGWPDPATAARYRAAMQLGNTAYCFTEYHRWAIRSLVRVDGLSFARRMRTPVAAPVLQIHGALDTCVLPSTAAGGGAYVSGQYRWQELPDVGHFPHEEAPDAVNSLVTHWLDEVEPAL